MDIKCAIMQPTYNPWIGYFDLMDKVDIFVFLDNVQLVKRSWQVRNRIKTPQGELFLTIPIRKQRRREETTIKNALINDNINWRLKHLKSYELNYKKAPFFEEVYPLLEKLLLNNISYLGDFNINFIKSIADAIRINTVTIRSSDMKEIRGKKDELLVSICKNIKCNIYISPIGSAGYIESKNPGGAFSKNKIELYYHNFEHPIYKQLHGAFLPYMGIVDLLFNVGFDKALDIIRKGRREDIHYIEIHKRLFS